VALFVATHDIDHSLRKEGEPIWPEYLFWSPTKNAEEYRKAAKQEFVVCLLSTLVSFFLFIAGLAIVVSRAASFALT
jgi:hypothetical protein